MRIMKNQVLDSGKDFQVFAITTSRKCKYCSGSVSVWFKVRLESRGDYFTFRVLEEKPQFNHSQSCRELKAMRLQSQPKNVVTFELISKVFPDKRVIDFSSQCFDEDNNIFEVTQRERCDACGGIVASRMKIQLYDVGHCFLFRTFDEGVVFNHGRKCKKFVDMRTDMYPFFNVGSRISQNFLEDLFPAMPKLWFERVFSESEIEEHKEASTFNLEDLEMNLEAAGTFRS